MKKTRKSILPIVIILAFLLYVSITLIHLQINISDKKETVEALQQEVQAQTRTNSELKSLLDADVDDDYIARVAREKLGYGSASERVFVNADGK